jgi:hypothetical protein
MRDGPESQLQELREQVAVYEAAHAKAVALADS